MAAAPLTMSHSKDDLLRHLNLSEEIYGLMLSEACEVYHWLTNNKSHLKKNSKHDSPYDWSDITEKAKDDAMLRLAKSENVYTSYYWVLAAPKEGCPNWIARWFLYHVFRYRDGRNKQQEERSRRHGSSSFHGSRHGSVCSYPGASSNPVTSAAKASSSVDYLHQPAYSSVYHEYQYPGHSQPSGHEMTSRKYQYATYAQDEDSDVALFYDPIRAEWVEK